MTWDDPPPMDPPPMGMTPMGMTPMGMTPMGMTGCFVAGTLVQLPNGIKYIEDIEIGDIVKSFDVGTSSIVDSKVTETFVHSDRYYMIINGIIKTTSVHPFYSDGNWIEAGDLSIGDKILHVDGLEHTIETIELSDEPVTVYNFEVDGTHNYFAEGYLVHNKAPMGMTPMGPTWNT
jgi:intein/homing endonuclease